MLGDMLPSWPQQNNSQKGKSPTGNTFITTQRKNSPTGNPIKAEGT